MRNSLTFFFLLVASLAQAAGVDPSLKSPSAPVIDVLTNGNFEARKAAWIASSKPTFTIQTATPLNGGASGVFTPTTSGQTLSTAQYSVPEGAKGRSCSASLIFKNLESTNLPTVQVIDGSSNLLSGSVQIPYSTQSLPLVIPYQCPTSGTMALKIQSSGSALALTLDDVSLGTSQLYQISQSQAYGSVSLAGCSYTRSSGTSFTNFTPNAGCTGTYSGNALSPATAVPGVKFSSAPAGHYLVLATGGFQTIAGTNNIAGFAISDGSSNGGSNIFVGQNANNSVNAYGDTIVAQFDYNTTQSNLTFQIQGRDVANTGVASINVADLPLGIYVYYYPNETQLAFKPETINWLVDANQNVSGVNPDLGTSSVGSYTDMTATGLTTTNNSVSTLTAQQSCSGTEASSGSTCTGDGDVGISFQLPAAQSVEACVSFTHSASVSASGNLQTTFEIVETPNNAQTISQSGASKINRSISQGAGTSGEYGVPYELCSVLHFSGAGKKTLRLMYQQFAVNVTQSLLLTDLSIGNRDVHWRVRPLTQNIPAPVLAGGVSSPSSGQAKLASLSSDSSGTISSTTGGWVSSVTHGSTGSYVYNLVSGTFTSDVSCTCSAIDNGSTGGWNCYMDSMSPTSVGIHITAGTTATDVAHSLICVGLK